MTPVNIFPTIRQILGSLNQQQVDTVNAILESCEKHAITDARHIAYILATGCHESALKPIAERLASRKGRPYNNPDPVTHEIYYGRGLIQLTHKDNYAKFAGLLHIDLVNHPELALQTDYAAEIACIGMKGGLFTGVGLSRYFNGDRDDPLNARKIINGLDKAELIAGYYKTILNG